MKFKKIIFDFDGVIINSHVVKSNAFKHIFKKYSKNIAIQAYKYHLNNIGKSRFIKFKYILKKNFKKFNAKQIINLNNEFDKYCNERIKNLKISKYLLFFLNEHYRKVKFYISTGTPNNLIRKLVKKKKIKKYFTAIYGSPKTKVDHIKSIIKKTDKKKILFIGDSNEDYLSAKKLKIVFLLKKNSENIKLSKNKSIKNFDNYIHLKKIINRM